MLLVAEKISAFVHFAGNSVHLYGLRLFFGKQKI